MGVAIHSIVFIVFNRFTKFHINTYTYIVNMKSITEGVQILYVIIMLAVFIKSNIFYRIGAETNANIPNMYSYYKLLIPQAYKGV